MPWETSAGGVVFREHRGELELAVIRPHNRRVWALPKGHVDPGETPEQTARREVREETGLETEPEAVAPLGEIRYVYRVNSRTIFKTVHFFLFRHAGGDLGNLDPAMKVEVDEVRWIPLLQARQLLGYRGERVILSRALAVLSQQGDLPTGT
jgi:8-oxo-dGTP pyrophosphatase MutT (NUDIX family)